MKRWIQTWLAALGLLATMGKEAQAMTSDGTLVTNVACATYSSSTVLTRPGFAVSYCATALLFVQNPCLALQKIASPSVQASGGTVTYTIWMVNCSPTGSAFNINLTDRLPDNVAVNANLASWNGNSGGVFSNLYGSNNSTWASGFPGAGQTAPYYLRYVLDQLGPNRSAFVSFAVTVL